MDSALTNVANLSESLNTMSLLSSQISKTKSDLQELSKSIERQQAQFLKDTLNAKEACEALGITEPTLIKRRNAGLIPYVKLGRNFYYLKPEAALCSK